MFAKRPFVRIAFFRASYVDIMCAPETVVPQKFKDALKQSRFLNDGTHAKLMHHIRSNYGILHPDRRRALATRIEHTIFEIENELARMKPWEEEDVHGRLLRDELCALGQIMDKVRNYDDHGLIIES